MSIKTNVKGSAVLAIASSTSTTQLFGASPAASGRLLYNASTSILYVKFGVNASTTDYSFQMVAGAFYDFGQVPLYNGVITGVWATANGTAQITEW